MKKNITINLCGRLFQIDEDAYEMLQHYTESLRSSFGKQEGGDEIVDDIEARIAELFDELKTRGTEAITIDHVKDIITRIGRPEELTGEENEKSSTNNEDNDQEQSARSAAQNIYNNIRERTAGKKLFRNPKDKMLAGVLSGFAAYTNTSPMVWRLLAILLFFAHGFGLLAYIILAIVMPEAKTPEQLLQMEGKNVTPQNLADAVIDKNEPIEQQSLLRNFFTLILKIAFGFFIAIAVLVGIACGISLLSGIVVLISALLFPSLSLAPLGLLGLSEIYNSSPIVVVTLICSVFILLLIPIYATIHMILSLTNKVQPMSIVQRIVWIVIWIAALCSIIICSIFIVNYKEKYDHENDSETYSTTYQGVEMSEEDADYLAKGGWNLLTAVNCEHYTSAGEYLDGNHNIRYLDAYNPACEEIVQIERKEKVEPGIYTLNCDVRAEGPGTFIYAIGNQTQLKEIPAYGNHGGELWESITIAKSQIKDTDDLRKEPKWKQEFWQKIAEANGEEGYGWSDLQIDSIMVTGDSIAYGVSTDKSFTGQPCHSQWFSATDFKLTRIGELPNKGK